MTSAAKPLPAGYSRLPSSYPASFGNKVAIAYAGNCSVESAAESQNLQGFAVALENWLYQDKYFANDCTGTLIRYDPISGSGFIVAAGHCVLNVSPAKAAGQQIKIP